MMSSRVSRLTLNGIFLITIAVGMISSSMPGVWAATGCCIVWGGDVPPDEMSELLTGGESDLGDVLSIHCCHRATVSPGVAYG